MVFVYICNMRHYSAMLKTHQEIDTMAQPNAIEAFLDCRDIILSDRNYDELVDRASAAAHAYNRELQGFQQHDTVVAQY